METATTSSSATPMIDESALSPEELKHKKRYDQLKEQAKNVEKANTDLVLKLRRAKYTIDRLKTERKILYDYLMKLTGQSADGSVGADEDREADAQTETRLKQTLDRKSTSTPSMGAGGTTGGGKKSSASTANGNGGAASKAGKGEPPSKKRKRSTVPKDKDAPKKPGNAFLVYCQMEKEKLAAEQPDIPWADMVKQLGVQWKALTAEERKIYQDAFEQQKARYEVEKREYEAKKAGTGVAGDINVQSYSSSPRAPLNSSQQQQHYIHIAPNKQLKQQPLQRHDSSASEMDEDEEEEDLDSIPHPQQQQPRPRGVTGASSLESEGSEGDSLIGGGEDDLDNNFGDDGEDDDGDDDLLGDGDEFGNDEPVEEFGDDN